MKTKRLRRVLVNYLSQLTLGKVCKTNRVPVFTIMEEMYSLRTQNNTWREIGAQYGLSKKSAKVLVKKYCKLTGYHIKPFGS